MRAPIGRLLMVLPLMVLSLMGELLTLRGVWLVTQRRDFAHAG